MEQSVVETTRAVIEKISTTISETTTMVTDFVLENGSFAETTTQVIEETSSVNFFDYVSTPVELLSLIISTIVSFTVIWKFWKINFSKKVKVLGINHSMSDFGDSVGVTIQNCTLSPISISKVYIVGEKEHFEIDRSKDPIIIDAKKIDKIETEKYSLSDFSFADMINNQTKLLIEFSDSKQTIKKFHKKRFRTNRKSKIIAQTTPITKIVYKDGDRLIMPSMKYRVFICKKDKAPIEIIVHKSGLLDCMIDDFNAIPVSVLDNKETLLEFFENYFGEKAKIFVEDYSIDSFGEN